MKLQERIIELQKEKEELLLIIRNQSDEINELRERLITEIWNEQDDKLEDEPDNC